MDTAITLDVAAVASIIGTVLAVGFALAALILRATSRIDADRRAFQAEAGANRCAFQAEMLRLAERHSHVEGRLDERGSPAD